MCDATDQDCPMEPGNCIFGCEDDSKEIKKMENKKETLFVSFSGGRTSAYMCWWLLNNKADVYDFIFIFANTGLEHENTLKFVNQCDKEWGLELVWVEAKVNPVSGARIECSVVSFETASRDGSPMRDVIAKHGVPNSDRSFCTQYTKTYVIDAYKFKLGFKRRHKIAIGMRADEADRMNFMQLEKGAVTYPLIGMKHTTKADVLMFFKDNSFDLEMDERLGNCITCYKKSDRHLMTLAKMDASYFDFFAMCEEKYGLIKDANGGECKPGDPYLFFRGNKSVNDILDLSKTSFAEFDPVMREFQLSLDIDPLDVVGDCGASCEVY